ncbi:MAG: DoxX family protein [bacterium]
MTLIMNWENWFRQSLNTVGEYLGLFILRLLLAWEYWESGAQKYAGENWFDHIKDNFPFPFSVINTEISWFMATWFELLGAIALIIGLGTRYVSIFLVILTIVATIAVHIPPEGWSSLSDMLSGYAITDKGFGNYKLPFMYMIMFMPLIFLGPGKLSIDHLISKYYR